MKKLVYFLILAWVLQSCCFFENLRVSKDISFMAGAGVSDVFGGESWKPKVGGFVGAETSIFDYLENSSVTTGLNLSFQGAAWEDDWGEGNYSGTTNLTYLNLPLLYRYETVDGFYGNAGLQAGLLLAANDKYDGMTESYLDYMNKFELGFPFGVGYRINEKVTVEVRAVFGLTNTDKYAGSNKDHNFSLNGVISYTLPFYNNRNSGNDQ